MRPTVPLMLALGISHGAVIAQDTATAPDTSRDADRKALLAIMADVEQGINEGDIERRAKHIDDTGIVTWLNAEVSHGPEGVRAYYKKMVGTGSDTILSKYVTHPKNEGPARFYGDVAVVNGTTLDEFTPHRRSVFKFDSRFTSTLVKRDGVWKVASLNLNTNTFNNVLIHELQSMNYWFAGGGFLAGVVTAWIVGVLRRRNRK